MPEPALQHLKRDAARYARRITGVVFFLPLLLLTVAPEVTRPLRDGVRVDVGDVAFGFLFSLAFWAIATLVVGKRIVYCCRLVWTHGVRMAATVTARFGVLTGIFGLIRADEEGDGSSSDRRWCVVVPPYHKRLPVGTRIELIEERLPVSGKTGRHWMWHPFWEEYMPGWRAQQRGTLPAPANGDTSLGAQEEWEDDLRSMIGRWEEAWWGGRLSVWLHVPSLVARIAGVLACLKFLEHSAGAFLGALVCLIIGVAFAEGWAHSLYRRFALARTVKRFDRAFPEGTDRRK